MRPRNWSPGWAAGGLLCNHIGPVGGAELYGW